MKPLTIKNIDDKKNHLFGFYTYETNKKREKNIDKKVIGIFTSLKIKPYNTVEQY